MDNNLNRADSVLSKAKVDDLEQLDLLVLPELAFTGTLTGVLILESNNLSYDSPTWLVSFSSLEN